MFSFSRIPAGGESHVMRDLILVPENHEVVAVTCIVRVLGTVGQPYGAPSSKFEVRCRHHLAVRRRAVVLDAEPRIAHDLPFGTGAEGGENHVVCAPRKRLQSEFPVGELHGGVVALNVRGRGNCDVSFFHIRISFAERAVAEVHSLHHFLQAVVESVAVALLNLGAGHVRRYYREELP